MADQRISDILRGRREQLGLSINQVANETNIRMRVLETFEKGDYANFPPKGYATGMLSSYARCLGLDPRMILTGYEEELVSFQHRGEIAQEYDNAMQGRSKRFGRRKGASQEPSKTGQFDPMMTGEIDTGGDIARATSAIKVVSRSDSRSSRSSRGAHAANSSMGRRVASSSAATTEGGSRLDAYRDYSRGRSTSAGTSPSATGRISYASANRSTADASSTGRISSLSSTRSSSPSTTGRLSTTSSSSASSGTTGRLSSLDIDSMTRSAQTEDSATREESGSSSYQVRGGKRYSPQSRTGSSSSRSKRRHHQPAPNVSIFARVRGAINSIITDKRSRLIALAIALIVVALIVAASILINSAGSESDGILDVSGGADGVSTADIREDGDGTATATITTANGNPVVIAIDVKEGMTSLINVSYDDDSAYNGTAVGPWHREFQVTGSMTAVFGTPGAVTVTENGEPIEIPTGSDGSGTLNLTVQASGLASGNR